MRVIELDTKMLPMLEAMEMASREMVILRLADMAFVLARVDDFEAEVELLRNNQEFMAYLRELSQAKSTISLKDLRKKLGLEQRQISIAA